MTCEHLIDLERALIAAGIKETSRGQAWSRNCREWVYFDCYLDTAAIRRRHKLPDVVEEHSHRGTHDGQEHGLVCSHCHDAIVGLFEPASGKPVFKG